MNVVEMTAESEDLRQKQYVIFQLGSEEYGVDINQAKEIIKPSRITKVPNTGEHILGVINLRGQIVPVLDLKKRLNLDMNAVLKEERIIIVNINDVLMGFLVDSVKGVVEVNSTDIEKVVTAEKGIKSEYIKGVAKLAEELLIVIDLDKVIFEKDLG